MFQWQKNMKKDICSWLKSEEETWGLLTVANGAICGVLLELKNNGRIGEGKRDSTRTERKEGKRNKEIRSG